VKNIAIISTVIITSCMNLNAQSNGWSIQLTSTSMALYGIAFSDSNICVAVGDGGTIVRSTDAGINWNLVASPVGDPLRAASFHGSIGLAVGIGGRVIRTTDAGASWVEQSRPTTRALYCVSMGDSMTVATGEEGGIFVSTDDGLSWTQRAAGTASILFGVSVYGSTAVGVGGRGAIVNSINRGDGWGLQVMSPDLLTFYSTSFINTSTGWAVGSFVTTGSVVLRSDLSGFTWALENTPTSNILFGVSFSSIDIGTAVGAGGTIIHTTDGGQIWLSQLSGASRILNAVSFANTYLGIAVGDSGTILRTTTGGAQLAEDGQISQFPFHFLLNQNYPNPFNPTTAIQYDLPRSADVKLEIFDILGRKIETLVNEKQAAGHHALIWDGQDKPSGEYFCKIQAGDFLQTRKMMLLK
jgi:photosystem II stability/assembly factor-like uncharacterized protein